MRSTLQFFGQDVKHVSTFLTRCEKCFTFFDKTQIVLHFFDKMLTRSISFFSTKREKSFFFGQDVKNVFFSDKMQKIIEDNE